MEIYGEPQTAMEVDAQLETLISTEDSQPRIVQLEEDVINRIAAGEVVVRPANALKELLENCLDAGSKHVAVALKGGGLKMLRIEDDGHGIREQDLPILCERFTTSKLRQYTDLSSISTFGFRGEALASISHVAFVTVTTMTAQDSIARVAQYTEGKLRGSPRPCAGTRGTTIVAEDMFHNNQTRRKALARESLEHAKCLEVVQKYSMHYPHVSFICRKAGSAVAELHTSGGAETTRQQVIATVHGSNLAGHLFEFSAASEDPKFHCRGLATGPEWTSRTTSLTLFINNRLIECNSLRRAVDAVYMPVLPRHQHPWVYLSLDLDPATVDVNVHPTKQEVQFLHEEAIAARIQEVLHAQLREKAGSRTFDSQSALLTGHGTGSLLGSGSGSRRVQSGARQSMLEGVAVKVTPAASTDGGADTVAVLDAFSTSSTGPSVRGEAKMPPLPLTDEPLAEPVIATQAQQQQSWVPCVTQRKPEEKTRIRTDHRQQSLESIFRKSSSEAVILPEPSDAIDLSQPDEERDVETRGSETLPPAASPEPMSEAGLMLQTTVTGRSAPRTPKAGGKPPRLPFEENEASRHAAFNEAQQLTSLLELRASTALACDKEFAQSVNQSVYVGPVSRELVLLQCGASLCLANMVVLAREFAYQRLLRLFGGPGRTFLREPLGLQETLRLGIQDPGSGYDPIEHADVDVEALANQFAALLVERAEMLHEYFMLDIEDGLIKGLPNALGISGDVGLKFDELPLFLVRLCTEVNWEDEKLCFESLGKVVAHFCVEQLLPCPEEAERCMAASADAGLNAAALNAAVEAGEFPDVAAAAQARAKRARIAGPTLQELRFLHEAVRNDAAAAGVEACLWPRSFQKDGTVVKLVGLEQLYRIFERC